MTRSQIKIRALRVANENNIEGFKASDRWLDRFCRRWGLANRRVTTKSTLGDKRREELNGIANRFLRQFLRSRKVCRLVSFVLVTVRLVQKGYKLSCILNMDEGASPCVFGCCDAHCSPCRSGHDGELHHRAHWHQTRESLFDDARLTRCRQVAARVTNRNKERVSVVLTIAADGTKFRPLLIFGRRKTLPKNLSPGVDALVQVQSSVLLGPWQTMLCLFQASGFMDEKCMLDYVDNNFRKGPANFEEELLMVLDSHSAHHTPAVLKAFSKLKTTVIKVCASALACA